MKTFQKSLNLDSRIKIYNAELEQGMRTDNNK